MTTSNAFNIIPVRMGAVRRYAPYYDFSLEGSKVLSLPYEMQRIEDKKLKKKKKKAR